MNNTTPQIEQARCGGCGACVQACPAGALGLSGGKAAVMDSLVECLYCGQCEATCPKGAIRCPLEVILR